MQELPPPLVLVWVMAGVAIGLADYLPRKRSIAGSALRLIARTTPVRPGSGRRE